MAEKFAFESGAVSIAFNAAPALGDTIIAKSVFDALCRLVPSCKIDVYCTSAASKSYVKAFYGGSNNLNATVSFELYAANVKKYDAAFRVWQMVLIDFANVPRLQQAAPVLLKALQGIDAYNKKYVYNTNDFGMILRNMVRARILGIDRYTSLSCGGALPIHDNRVEISLTPEGKAAFNKLKLRKKYITIGSNMKAGNSLGRHSLKEWPTRYAVEYISLLNRHCPQIEVVQIGGGGVYQFANADRHIFDADLELVKYLLKNSLLHVDCESGLVHLATQLGTKCLVLFGPTDVEYYGFKENLNVVSETCYPCVFAWDNGSTCLRGAKEPPCMMSHTPQTVFEVTRNYLSHLDV